MESSGSMESSQNWPRIEESLFTTLARNLTIASCIACVFALVRHDFTRFIPVAILALWPSLGGHYVEVAFVNLIRTRVPQGQVAQVLLRLLVWYVGGILLYFCMVATSHALPVGALPMRLWWSGGLLFVGLELSVHAILAARRQPSFYGGRG